MLIDKFVISSTIDKFKIIIKPNYKISLIEFKRKSVRYWDYFLDYLIANLDNSTDI